MGTYYNHFIEHPLFWSDEQKRWANERLSRECFEVWQAQKRLERSEKLRNQSEV
jgi:uncharacterized protein YdaU (DUF1376 family)